jgi:cytochrome c-type biogenesis protein CcmF
MIAAIGRSTILLSLLVATIGAMVAFAAAARNSEQGRRLARMFAYAFGGLMTFANVLMVYALLTHDFSVSYVAAVGSTLSPTWVSVVSLWSSLEGSILFWGFVLGAFIAAATWTNRSKHPEYMGYAIGIWLACGAFFAFLIAGPANPFHTVLNPPLDGPGPNPLLQNHILMVLHPPLLYLGYVGMTIPFGFASAALMAGRLGHAFLAPIRSWLLASWAFLTLAIMLGGWWAYEVLGWGGYWAWDPVENASLLPWLTATAALHSIIVVERKGILKGWTITLVQATFLLVILGTFMTRSGVFNSVHSFTQSAIGPTILGFLAASLFLSVALLALRIDKLTSEGTIESAASREGTFLLNNLLFVLFTLTVLIGTAFPLIVEAVKGTQMSVGRPYFDKMTVPIGVALLFLMGVGPALPWGRVTKAQMQKALLPPAITGFVFIALGLLLGARNFWTLVALLFGGYAAHVTTKEMWRPFMQRFRKDGVGRALVEAQFGRGRRRFGAYVIHAGVILAIIAIGVSSTMQVSREATLGLNESVRVGEYNLTFIGSEIRDEPNRQATIAHVAVERNGKRIGEMTPRMNQYLTMREPIGTPHVRTGITSDLYLSVLNIDTNQNLLGLHILINPMVGWIWIAVGLMGLGSIFALIPLRRAALAVPAAGAERIAEAPAVDKLVGETR